MDDNLSNITEAIRKASEAYAEAIAAVSKGLQNIAPQMGDSDRDRLVENWLRLARMSKDGIITAMEQAYEFWEREVRRTITGSTSPKSSSPMDAWIENLRKATDAFAGGNWSEEVRKQAVNVQRILNDGIRLWQRIWEPERK